MQEVEEPVAVPVKERIEYRRVLHHLLEAAFGRIRLLSANKEIYFFYVGQIQKRVRQPDLADEAGNADQHDVLSRECPANGKSRGLSLPPKIDDGPGWRERPPLGGNDCGAQVFHGDIELSRQSLRSPAPVWILFPNARERPARTDHGLD